MWAPLPRRLGAGGGEEEAGFPQRWGRNRGAGCWACIQLERGSQLQLDNFAIRGVKCKGPAENMYKCLSHKHSQWLGQVSSKN